MAWRLEQRLGRAHHGGETLALIARHPHPQLRRPDSYTASGMRSRSALACVESSSIGATASRPPREDDRARARRGQLDAGVLHADEVVERVGQRPEAVLELLAQHDQLGHVAGAATRRCTSILASS